MDINKSIVDKRYQNSSHSLRETDSSTVNLKISAYDLSLENKVLI